MSRNADALKKLCLSREEHQRQIQERWGSGRPFVFASSERGYTCERGCDAASR